MCSISWYQTHLGRQHHQLRIALGSNAVLYIDSSSPEYTFYRLKRQTVGGTAFMVRAHDALTVRLLWKSVKGMYDWMSFPAGWTPLASFPFDVR
jgi:hypothetical protein